MASISYKDPTSGAWTDIPFGGEITVDSELSKTSENPVQNKGVTAKLNEQEVRYIILTDLTTAITEDQVNILNANKQNYIVYDNHKFCIKSHY